MTQENDINETGFNEDISGSICGNNKNILFYLIIIY